MSAPGPGSAWRLLLLQASWNRRDMQSWGWVVARLPWLRRQGLDPAARSAWLAGELRFANTNPHVAGLLLGALDRVEGEQGPGAAARLRDPLSRALGAVGDRLVWFALQPAFQLLALLVALGLARGEPGATAPAVLLLWAGVAVALLWLRVALWRRGWREGVAVVAWLKGSWLNAAARGLQRVARLLSLLLVPVALLWPPATAAGVVAWLPAAVGLGALLEWRGIDPLRAAAGVGIVALALGWRAAGG